MLIHQEETVNTCEGWINLNQISYIEKQNNIDGSCSFKCYLVADNDPLTISESTFNKIISQLGVI